MINKLYEKIKQFFKENYRFLILLTTIVFLFYYEFPYVIYKSGGTINLEDRVVIDKEYEEKGDLKMSYVTAMKGTAPFIMLSWVLPDWDLIPLKEITNEDSYEDVLEVGKEYLNEGIDNAIMAAFQESSYSITITNTHNKVIYLSKDAKTDIVVGDELISVDGNEITNLEELKSYINSKKVGELVEFTILRNGETLQKESTIYQDGDDLKVGIAFKTTYEYRTEIPVTVKMKDNESGSSGGLMMSLAIYNALTEKDLTKGLNIVGTGSINSDGTVEEIDCVKYKVLAAEKNKADIFFCPVENYEEALKVKKRRKLDVEVVKVASLKEAIAYLETK